MSEFCGKCDVCDCYSDYSEERLQNSKFFIYGEDGKHHELKINNQKDLAKYYPYLVSSSASDKHRACVNICSRPFIDEEEEEMIEWTREILVKYYKSCKRKKVSYDIDEALRRACWFTPYEDWEKELAHRVGECGEKAKINDLHRSMHEYYRNLWYEELVRQGYNEDEAYEWVYGWERYWNKKNNKAIIIKGGT